MIKKRTTFVHILFDVFVMSVVVLFCLVEIFCGWRQKKLRKMEAMVASVVYNSFISMKSSRLLQVDTNLTVQTIHIFKLTMKCIVNFTYQKR